MINPPSLPVLACSFSASAAAERADRWRVLIDTELLDRTPTAAGQRLAFRPRPAVAVELDELVAAESECCPFMTLTVERADERLILDIEAPPEALAIVETMFRDVEP